MVSLYNYIGSNVPSMCPMKIDFGIFRDLTPFMMGFKFFEHIL